MFLTEKRRRQLLRNAIPKWRVARSRDRNWQVWCGQQLIAVFIDWRDAIDYATRKASE